jgi:hypothetical protein
MQTQTETLANTAPAGGLGYANQHGYSDIHPYEVVEVVKPGMMKIREMNSTLQADWKPEIIPGGFVGHCANQGTQRWDYVSSATAQVKTIRQSHAKGRKNGKWFDKHGNEYVPAAKPRRFHDYNF